MGCLPRRLIFAITVRALAALVLTASPAFAAAQRHSFGSSPPTAPPSKPVPAAPPSRLVPPGPSTLPSGPIAPVSSGMGAIQFQQASVGTPAPQTLTRQLSSDDEHTRSGVLSALGAPAQYLGYGHVPYPHSMQLDLVQLGASDELDALLTIELDQHIVSAVLVPDGDLWRRIATLTFATAFSNASATPSTFVRPLRSWLEPGRYRAVFRAAVTDGAGDFTENEVDVRIVNSRAVVVLDFVSGARQCDPTGQLRPAHQSCELIQRWLEPDPTDPTHHFALITGTGHFSAHEADDPLSRSRNYRLTRLRSFTCQPFAFSEGAMRFEPTATATACIHEPVPHAPTDQPHSDRPLAEHSEHTAAEHLDHP